MFILIHIVLGFAALISGAIVLFKLKGTTVHRFIGMFYFISIIVINVSAFTITNNTGSYGVFHILALVNLVTTILGFVAIKMGSIQSHYHLMHWSYAGLMSATINQVFVNIPFAAKWLEKIPLLNIAIIIPMFLLTFIVLQMKEDAAMKKYDNK